MRYALKVVMTTLLVMGTLVSIVAGIVSIIGAAQGNPDVIIDIGKVAVNVSIDFLDEELLDKGNRALDKYLGE